MGRRKGGIGKRSRIRLGTELDVLGAIGEVMGSEGAVPETPPPLDSLSSALARRWRRGAGRAGRRRSGATLASTFGLPNRVAGRRLGAGRGAVGGGGGAIVMAVVVLVVSVGPGVGGPCVGGAGGGGAGAAVEARAR